MYTQTTSRALALIAAVSLSWLTASSIVAAPADDISRAVAAGGAASVEAATPVQFIKAYSSVLTRVDEQKFPQYVTAGTKLRPDLAPQITTATLRAHRADPKDTCNWVDPIIRAAIAAAPDAKRAIVRAALDAEPYARECILAAAGMSSGDDSQQAFFRPPGVDAGNINSTSIGTINPGNISGQGNVVSQAQPNP